MPTVILELWDWPPGGCKPAISLPSVPIGSAAPAAPRNLVISAQVRHALVLAFSRENKLVASHYRLTPPGIYYAFDPAQGTYWAGAGVEPKRGDIADGVNTQDNGSYGIYFRRPGGSWQEANTGMVARTAYCRAAVPAAVRVAWGWPAGSCRPPGD